MTLSRVLLEESLPMSPEELWAVMSDHEGMSDWLDAQVTVIAGEVGGGVGTIRRIHLAPGLSIDEEVTYADAPRRMVYRIVRGGPGIRFHRGEVLIEPWGDSGSQLSWDIQLSSPIPGLASLVLKAIGSRLRRGLSRLRARHAA